MGGCRLPAWSSGSRALTARMASARVSRHTRPSLRHTSIPRSRTRATSGRSFSGVSTTRSQQVPWRHASPLRLLRVARDIDLGTGPTGGPERRVENPAVHTIILAFEVDLAFSPPEGVAHLQEFLRTPVALIVVEEVPVAVLFGGGASGDQIQGNPSSHQQRERVELLHEGRRLHPARAEGRDELQPVRLAPERTGTKQRIRLVRTARDQHRFDPDFLRSMCESQPALHVGLAGRRTSLIAAGAESGRLFRGPYGDLPSFRQHPVKSQIHATPAASIRRICRLPDARAASVNSLPQRSKVRPSAGRRVDRPTAPTPMEGCRRRGIHRATVA